MTLDAKSSKKLLDDVLAVGRKAAPGADLRLSLTSGRRANTRFARGEITSAGDVDDTVLSVTVSFGKRHAAARTNQVDAASVRVAVASAARLARLSPEDPEWMPALGAQKYNPQKGAFDPATGALTAETRAAAAGATITAGAAAKLDMSGFFEHSGSSQALATSAGLSAWRQWTSVGFTCTARTPDASGSGWAGASSNRIADVDAAAAARIAADKAVRSAKARRLEPGRYTVILEPAAVAELAGFMTSALAARSADEGRSFFSKKGGGNKLGEKILGDAITLRSSPADVATGAAPFDNEGLPLAPITWIDKGTVSALYYSRYWAQKQGKQTTGQYSSFELVGGTAKREELLKGVKKGVLITRFWYTRWVDPQTILITGLTRDGVFLVENGDIVAPVNNFRFNESPITMLKNADLMTASEVAPGGGWRAPALRTNEFNLASVSEAV